MEDKVALVFGGQGSQYTGMGMRIYKLYEEAKAVFELASSVVGYDVAKMCFEASQEVLNKTIFCQICTLTVELAIYKIFLKRNIPYHIVAGFSLGEYSALVASGILDMRNAFELVKVRATAMETETKENIGRMIAVINLSVSQVEALCKEFGNDKLFISNFNSYNQIVVSCINESLTEVMLRVRSLGGIAIPLKVNKLFHHPTMRSAADEYKVYLNTQHFNRPQKDIFLNVTGGKSYSGDELKNELYEQIYTPVQWIKTVENIIADGVTKFYEISPKPTLATLINNISKGTAMVMDVQEQVLNL